MNVAILAIFLCGQTDSLRLSDGSTLVGDLEIDKLEITTTYGKHIVPWDHVMGVQMGNRPNKEGEQEIAKAIGRLGSGSFTERDKATKDIAAFKSLALPQLLSVAKSDPETEKRVMLLISQIKKNDFGRSEVSAVDVVDAKEFTIKGQIADDAFTIKSKTLGKVKVNRHDIYRITKLQPSSDVSIVANDEWQKIVVMNKDNTLKITAMGTVDLWPPTPGQFTCGPDGYSTIGRNSSLKAGTLAGRLGENGPEFAIGAQGIVRADSQQTLYLRVVPSPWNQQSSGHYTVTIKSDTP